MPEPFDLDAEITRLLTPRKTLAPWIFAQNGLMKKDVREALLNIARKIVAETVGTVAGLEVADVYLVGSAPQYLYKDTSDFDIRIEVHNTSCADLPTDDNLLNDFLIAQKVGFFARKYNMRLNGHFVDVQITSKKISFFGVYSIKNNKWVIKPSKNYAEGLTLKDMKAYYLQRKTEVLDKFEQIQAENKGIKCGKKLEEYLEHLLQNFYLTYETKNIKEYFTYKLFHCERVLKSIRYASGVAFNEEFKREDA